MMQLDPSSSAIIPSQQPQASVEAVTYMDSDLFNAAEDGDIELFNNYQGGLHCLVDGRRNTALHIYSRAGGRQVVKTDKRFLCFQKKRFEREFSINFVQQLVDKCPSLLLQPNAREEIPLHVAVRHGHSEIVKCLIERAKVVQHEDLEKGTPEATSSRLRLMLRMRDKEGNTAFHKAAGTGNIDVVRLLVKEIKELDPDFSFFSNKKGETPLYIAAKRRKNHLVVAEILENCKSVDYGGPNGTTALHVAVLEYKSRMTVEKLIEANNQLTKEIDDKGWTPLHYAARCGFLCNVELLLKADASAAYITDKERGMSALHMAAWQGDTRMMELIISLCPGCCEIVDNKGWNFLHIAFASLSPKVIETFLLGHKNMIKDFPIGNLLDEKDVNGNTPLHVFLFGPALDKEYGHQVFLRILSFGLNESVYYRFLDSETTKKQIQEVLKDIANNAELVEISWFEYLYNFHEKNIKEDEDIAQYEIEEKARESHLLVATLIATVTFAAAFTVPGGYKNEQGTAALSHDSPFKAFVITNTLAFISSLLAVFIHFLFVLLDTRGRKSLVRWIHIADWLTFFAVVAMVIAFSTGTYAVLKSSLRFAIATCFLSLLFFPGLLVVYFGPIFLV